MRAWQAIIGAVLLAACATDGVTVSLVGEQDGLATFRVVNASGREVAGLRFSFVFTDPAGAVVRVDTVDYAMADGEEAPFVGANAETTITQRMPGGAREAAASVLGVTWVAER